MSRHITVGELVRALAGLPEDLPVIGLFDTCILDEVGAVFVAAARERRPGLTSGEVVVVEVGGCPPDVDDPYVARELWRKP